MDIARPIDNLQHWRTGFELRAGDMIRRGVPDGILAARKQYALLISPPLSWRNREPIFKELKRLGATIDEVAGSVIELDDKKIRFVVHVEPRPSIIYQLASLGFTAPNPTEAPGFDPFNDGIDLDNDSIVMAIQGDYMATFEGRKRNAVHTPTFVVNGERHHIDVAYEYNDDVKMVDTCIAFFERSWKLYHKYTRNVG